VRDIRDEAGKDSTWYWARSPRDTPNGRCGMWRRNDREEIRVLRARGMCERSLSPQFDLSMN
jgi:hypothetical protein